MWVILNISLILLRQQMVFIGFKSHDTLFMWTLMKEEVKREHEPVTNKFISDEPAITFDFYVGYFSSEDSDTNL